MKISIRGTICRNDDKWVYDYLAMDATCPRDVTDKLDTNPTEAAEIYINSPGGEISSGMEMYAAIRAHKGPVAIHVTGYAASAASMVMCAGRCDISPPSMVMIHNVSSDAHGDYRDMTHEAQVLRTASEAICAAYVAKTGKTAAEIQKLMDKETWMTAQQAVDLGLCDAITGADPQLVAAFTPVIPQAGIAKMRAIREKENAWEALEKATQRKNKLEAKIR